MTTPAIRVRHLWHRFGQFDVLRDVSFEVAPGEIYGFIGPNGAGKTTTIRIMATLLEPLAGRVEIDGIDVALEPEAVRRIIGYMPDHAGVYERVTVREYLEFFADAYRVHSLGVVDAVLELTDIVPLRDRLVAELSKGQKQRLGLARILLHDPKVLILDEPASDLDPRARIEIRDLLLDLRTLGKTILLSSHILTELSDVCTSVGILEQGHMVVSGPIGQIGERLATQRAAQASGLVPEPGAVPVAAAAPERRGLKLRVLGDPSAAAVALQGGPGIVDVAVVGATVQVGYLGGDEKVAQIVRRLCECDVGVVGVEREQNELERIFLEATRRPS
ncbi:MAG: ABC transporter ATP-binding protein [Polyangiaceae bacterium]|nr:ABC transporter ATP-binding protein [Polyangiaceae bacterium]